jgi:hypothetical protein
MGRWDPGPSAPSIRGSLLHRSGGLISGAGRCEGGSHADGGLEMMVESDFGVGLVDSSSNLDKR